jgi:hypothetical protein
MEIRRINKRMDVEEEMGIKEGERKCRETKKEEGRKGDMKEINKEKKENKRESTPCRLSVCLFNMAADLCLDMCMLQKST